MKLPVIGAPKYQKAGSNNVHSGQGERMTMTAKQSTISEQIEALNKVRLGTKQYVRLDDVLKIIKEQEDGNSKADKKESRRI